MPTQTIMSFKKKKLNDGRERGEQRNMQCLRPKRLVNYKEDSASEKTVLEIDANDPYLFVPESWPDSRIAGRKKKKKITNRVVRSDSSIYDDLMQKKLKRIHTNLTGKIGPQSKKNPSITVRRNSVSTGNPPDTVLTTNKENLKQQSKTSPIKRLGNKYGNDEDKENVNPSSARRTLLPKQQSNLKLFRTTSNRKTESCILKDISSSNLSNENSSTIIVPQRDDLQISLNSTCNEKSSGNCNVSDQDRSSIDLDEDWSFIADAARPAFNSTMVAVSKPSTPWRIDDNLFKQNPHFLELKQTTTVPRYNQQPILVPNLVEHRGRRFKVPRKTLAQMNIKHFYNTRSHRGTDDNRMQVEEQANATETTIEDRTVPKLFDEADLETSFPDFERKQYQPKKQRLRLVEIEPAPKKSDKKFEKEFEDWARNLNSHFEEVAKETLTVE